MKALNHFSFLLIFVALTCFFSPSSHASHSMGGEITVSHLSGITYKVKLRYWRYVSGIPAPSSMQLQVQNISNLLSPAIPNATLIRDSVYNFSPNLIQEAFYSGNINLSDSMATFRLIATECCRNSGVINISNSALFDMVYQMEYTPFSGGMINTSPQFNVSPGPIAAINQIYTHSPNVVDPDGDSLAFVPTIPLDNSGSSFNPIPSPILSYQFPWAIGNTPYLFDTLTGTFMWLPNAVGIYALAYKVEEWRSGVKIGEVRREYQINVTNGGANTTPPSLSLNGTPQTTLSVPQFTAIPETNFNLSLSIVDADNTVQSIVAQGEMLTPAFISSFSTSNTNGLVGTFNWNTQLTEIRNQPYLLHMQYRETAGLYTFTRDIPVLIYLTGQVSGTPNVEATEKFELNRLNQDQLGIRLSLASTQNVEFTLYDLQGKAHRAWNTGLKEKGEHMILYSLSGLATGMYLIHAQSSNGWHHSARYIHIVD